MKKVEDQNRLAIMIPTYKRVRLLKLLLSDLMLQTIQPDLLVIVDGDTASGEVKILLSSVSFPHDWKIVYVPSNHSNAAYHRYLGASIAKDCQLGIFIDDDIRIPESDVIEKTIFPFTWNGHYVVGASPKIVFSSRINTPIVKQPNGSKWFRVFRSSNNIHPGGLTPVGDRILPLETNEPYSKVDWLRGGMMAFRMTELSKVIFMDDLFAMYQNRIGLGDDTYFSYKTGLYGELFQVNCASILHPDSDISQAYPADARRLAYARAYSRRFINDHFRVNSLPTLRDRLALVISLLGNAFLNWKKAMKKMTRNDFQYAYGYTSGALHAFFQKPTAKNLTPSIDWWKDAEEALSKKVLIQ